MNKPFTKPLRVAVIGTGYFSRFHYAAWQRMPDVQLVGLLTLDQQEALQFQEEFNVDEIYTDLDAMIEQADIDLIDIVSPPSTHATFIRQCIDHNIAVVCQKPFCHSVIQAEALVSTIKEKNALVVVHENFRFQPWYQQIKHIVNAGQLGKIYEINFNFRPGDGQGRQAYLARQPYFQTQTRFFIQETGIHYVDVFRYLLGDITGLFARLAQLNPVMSGEDAGVVVMEFASGARGVLNGNRLSDHAANNARLTMGELRIEGADGVLTLNGDGQIHVRAHGSHEAREHLFEWQDIDFGGDCVYNTNRHIADHLLNGSSVQNLAEDYIVNRQIEEAIYNSSKLGQWMPIST